MTQPDCPRSVAILVDHLYNYQIHILNGIRSQLQQLGLSSMVYLGRELRTSRTSWLKANDLYTQLNPENHCGLLSLSASLSTHTTHQDFLQFLQQYGLPTISIGVELAGMPSVLSDNKPGMQDLMDHLIRVRGFRRFVFVRGIEGNVDSQEREQVFLDNLQANGLQVPPEHILTGKFQSILAHREMQKLLVHTRDFEAVVSCNDEMTEGIIQALTEQGIRVPEDIAVVGFDDNEDFRYAIPALTTVRLPFYEQGEVAAQLLLQVLDGQSVPEITHIQTQLVVRQSCGHQRSGTAQAEGQQWPFEQDNLKRQLLSCLTEGVHHAGFLARWKGMILACVRSQQDIHIWQDWLEAVYQDTAVPLTVQQQRDFDRLCFQLQKFLIHAQQMVLARHKLLRAFDADTKWHLDMALMSQSNYSGLYEQMGLYLKTLDLKRYFLVVYEFFGPEPAPFGRVVLAEGHQGSLDSESFVTRDVLPRSMWSELQEGHLVMTALFSGEEHFGYLLFEQPEQPYFNEEGFRQALSGAFFRLDQSLAVRDYTEGLEKQVLLRTRQLQEEVRERRYAEQRLQEANIELQRYAFLDGLTGLYNRAAFDDHLQRLWQDHLERQQPLSVLLCDVDFFKLYNDHYGHLKGDQCLKDIAALLRRCTHNPQDVVARYGGEEFVLILPESSLSGALTVAERLHRHLQEAAIPHEMSKVSDVVTLSIGAASIVPAAHSSPRALLEEVDGLLYQSKREGRARTSWNQPARRKSPEGS
ncbi:diguanylate cyclase domain-containing protein [Deinococcus roseus]|uniref:GGDEF domain-containing protein n=1 Tax=Deinococcus roseus TaxID=392414 RepID=A0ABQ2DEI3_9DEIO|nr:diguanylate cyclase [Deinococcus roseus]GGJ54721.1 hypothetical protein GCM10008938_45990 [Deinococcus roseus]